MTDYEEDTLALERLVDSSSLSNVISALATISERKAEHLRVNWQDDASAKAWEVDAIRSYGRET